MTIRRTCWLYGSLWLMGIGLLAPIAAGDDAEAIDRAKMFGGDGCSRLELDQVCGPASTSPTCGGRTSIAFESENRFVARDSGIGPDGTVSSGQWRSGTSRAAPAAPTESTIR